LHYNVVMLKQGGVSGRSGNYPPFGLYMKKSACEGRSNNEIQRYGRISILPIFKFAHRGENLSDPISSLLNQPGTTVAFPFMRAW
jgi:hypothetical protein